MRSVTDTNSRMSLPGHTLSALMAGAMPWTTKSTGTGTIDLKIIAADGSTAVAVATQITATTGWQTGIELPPGQYAIVIATFTANYVALTRVPGE